MQNCVTTAQYSQTNQQHHSNVSPEKIVVLGVITQSRRANDWLSMLRLKTRPWLARPLARLGCERPRRKSDIDRDARPFLHGFLLVIMIVSGSSKPITLHVRRVDVACPILGRAQLA